MIKFAALNATEDAATVSPCKNKEVIETDAFQRYNKSLALIKNKDYEKAEIALKELLLHPYFNFDDETFSGSDFFNDPAVKLLTSIYKNLGKVHENMNNYDDALECYLEAVSSDKSDISTWYNIAKVAIKKVNYTLACDSLKECLNINPSFWPSIDTLICLLYALGDYLSCLHLIQHALSLNIKFERALCVKEEIKKEDPFLFKNFSWKEGLADLKPTDAALLKEMKYPLELREKDQQARKLSSQSKSDPVLYLREISIENSLADLGIAITELFIKVKEEELSLFCPVDFSKSNVHDLSKDSTDCEKNIDVDSAVIGPAQETKTCTDVVTPIDDNTVESQHVTEDDAHPSDPAKKDEGKLYKELLRREGYRRSKRVKEMQEDNNEELETLISELESWVPAILKSASRGLSPKHLAEGSVIGDKEVTSIEGIDELGVVQDITIDTSISLIPLMKKYCNKLSSQYPKTWPASVTHAFLKVYLSYREYEALPNILQNFREDDTEDNVLTLLCAFEIIVNNNLFPGGTLDDICFVDLQKNITKSCLEKDQEFLRTANGHELVKSMFSSGLLYDSFQLRYAWAYCLYEQKLGNIECAVEFVKLCIAKFNDCELQGVVVANSKIPFVSSVTLNKQKDALAEIQERENVANLFKEKKYSRVVEVLLPILDERQHDLDIDNGRLPTRHKNLLILLESLRKVSMMNKCLRCCDLLLHELAPFIRFTDTWKSLLTKIFKSLDVCLKESKSEKEDYKQYSRIMSNVIKIVVAFFDKLSLDNSDETFDLAEFPIERALITYHLIIDKYPCESDKEDDLMTTNIAKIQSLVMCHDLLGKYNLCCMNNGLFLSYVIECCLNYKENNVFLEDTTNIFEQAVFCYVGHPGSASKRYKKNRVDHSSHGVELKADIAKNIYGFVVPDEMFAPMDKSKHVSGDTFDLLTRIVGLIDNISDSETYLKIKLCLEKGTIENYSAVPASGYLATFRDIFYICGDYLWKYEDFSQAVDWYVSDLALNPERIDSWLALGLCWLSIAEDRFNHAQSDLKVVIESLAPKALLCFDHYIAQAPPTFEVLSEYSSFLYTIASVYNQAADALVDTNEGEPLLLQEIEMKRNALITKAKEMLLKSPDPSKPECWVKNFMLGKIHEKLKPVDLIWLELYMRGFRDLEEYTSTLSKKINCNSPAEYSIECLELAYRVSYSIYKQSLDHPELIQDERIMMSLKKILDMMTVDIESLCLERDDKPLLKLILRVLDECLARFPEHYKVRNALCKIYAASGNAEECQKAKSLMLQNPTNINALFLFSRKHLFFGIWRIPVDAVDRPGGFFRHMRKSLSLLIASLTHCQDIDNMMKLFEYMFRTADQLNNFVGDIAPFLHTSITTFDALVRNRVSEYCSQNTKHTTEQSVELLKLTMRAKNVHSKAIVDTKPIDEAILVLLKLFKLTVPQQLTICDPHVIKEAFKLHDIAMSLINDFEHVQKVAKLLELEKQKTKQAREAQFAKLKEPFCGVVSGLPKPTQEQLMRIQVPECSGSDNQHQSKTTDQLPISNQKILVNDNAKTAIRQAVATFITQMAENNQTKTKNVSQFLNIINSSIQAKGNNDHSAAKIREILLKAANKVNDQKGMSKKLSNIATVSKGTTVCNTAITTTANIEYGTLSSKRISPLSLKNALPKLQKTMSVLAKNHGKITKNPISNQMVARSVTGNVPQRVNNSTEIGASLSLKNISNEIIKSMVSSEAPSVTLVTLPEKSLDPPSKSDQELVPKSVPDAGKVATQATPYKEHNLTPVILPPKHDDNNALSAACPTSPIAPQSISTPQPVQPPSPTPQIKIEKEEPPIPVVSENRKRHHSNDSESDDSDGDEMPSLDDVPSIEPGNSAKKGPGNDVNSISEYRKMPNLNIADIHRSESAFNANNIPMLNPPQLIKKEISPPPAHTAPFLQSPPPMYCRADSMNKMSESNTIMPGLIHQPRKPSETQQDDYQSPDMKQYVLTPLDTAMQATPMFGLDKPHSLTPSQLANQSFILPKGSPNVGIQSPNQIQAYEQMGINNPSKKSKVPKAPRIKKERPPKKKKVKDETQKPKKREKKRKVDSTGTLKQFDFPFIEKNQEMAIQDCSYNSQPMVRNDHGSTVNTATNQAYFRQTSQNNMPPTTMLDPYQMHSPPLNMVPPNNIIVPQNSEEKIYKPEDFFAGASSSPQNISTAASGSFLGGSDLNSPLETTFDQGNNCSGDHNTPSKISDSSMSMFSPTSSENLSSENLMDDDSHLENVDLGILNELDGCDFTDEKEKPKHVVPLAKPKRGRKPKDPNKPKAPSKRKKTKKQLQAEQATKEIFCPVGRGQTSGAQFIPPNSPYSYATHEINFPHNGAGSPPKQYFYGTTDPMYSTGNGTKVAISSPSLQPHTVPHPTTLGLPINVPHCSPLTSPVNMTYQQQYVPHTTSPTTPTTSFGQSTPTTLTHFSGEDTPKLPPTSPKLEYGVQYPLNSFENHQMPPFPPPESPYPSTPTHTTPTVTLKHSPLQAASDKDSPDNSAEIPDNPEKVPPVLSPGPDVQFSNPLMQRQTSQHGFAMQYPNSQYNHTYPTSLYPEHSSPFLHQSPTTTPVTCTEVDFNGGSQIMAQTSENPPYNNMNSNINNFNQYQKFRNF